MKLFPIFMLGGIAFLGYEYMTKGKYDLISQILGKIKGSGGGGGSSSSNYASFNKRGGYQV